MDKTGMFLNFPDFRIFSMKSPNSSRLIKFLDISIFSFYHHPEEWLTIHAAPIIAVRLKGHQNHIYFLAFILDEQELYDRQAMQFAPQIMLNLICMPNVV